MTKLTYVQYMQFKSNFLLSYFFKFSDRKNCSVQNGNMRKKFCTKCFTVFKLCCKIVQTAIKKWTMFRALVLGEFWGRRRLIPGHNWFGDNGVVSSGIIQPSLG